MARRKPGRRTRPPRAGRDSGPKGRAKYTPAEWAMAVLGAAILVLIVGMVVSAILG